MAKLTDRLRSAWNAFTSRDPTDGYRDYSRGISISGSRPDRFVLAPTNGQTIIASIYNRIAVDVSNISFVHARIDDDKRYSEDINDSLNIALSLSSNLDQAPKAFFRNLVLALLDEGVVAVVPVNKDPNGNILDLRVGRIVEWQPNTVKVELYDDRDGVKKQIYCLKSETAIIENPFYSVMNAHNSTKERLIHKMALLDKMDNAMASNKLDLIIQVPYLTKSPAQKKRADKRVEDLTEQMANNPFGIAWSDGTEKIIQLNRSVTNNLPEEVKNLQTDLFEQLGITQPILDGTATADQETIYHNHTIEPICDAICEEFTRKFLTSTAITQGQRILYYSDPFKLTTLTEISEAVQYLIPNQVVTANEIRTGLGLKPSDQPQADQLINPNINTVNGANGMAGDSSTQPEEYSEDGADDTQDNPMSTPVSMLTD